MVWLVLDTSAEKGVIALTEEDRRVVAERPLLMRKGHSHRVLTLLDDVLQESGRAVSDLQRVVVGCGPGSYTGIRVGVMLARSLAYALDLPLVGVCSLLGLAPREEGVYLLAADARGGRYYCLRVEVDGQRRVEAGEPHLLTEEELQQSSLSRITPQERDLDPLVYASGGALAGRRQVEGDDCSKILYLRKAVPHPL